MSFPEKPKSLQHPDSTWNSSRDTEKAGRKSEHRAEPVLKGLGNWPKNSHALTLLTEKAMATHSSTIAWKIPWTEEPGGLQSMGSLRIGHDWATSLSLFTFMHWRRTCQPLQCSCLENPRDGGAWWVAVYGVAQSRTWPKRLSSSSTYICRQSLVF